ncbi:MAG: Rpn family recombination-promoting nuclease/putative transposase [Candidatus Delongbacteria bacterium]|nr:Rpn family recombination-promoting nuclease/putative transposase [Candidatus Delongbacteria bacterium]MBN2835464.1 Rpn family recombination-promoting nuclease/putative transposase [Candidatus Delongbacteria bacterium]
MVSTKEKYINPFTDFGFKKLFGEEANKDLLLDFLNELLKNEQGVITSINFNRSELLGEGKFDRKAIFDIYCENEKGEKFIVEIQKAKQQFFKDRSVFYSTFPIREQAARGDWDFKLKKVYTIAILDFVFEEDKNDLDKFIYFVKLSDIETSKIFYDKLTFVYIEMPKFKKSVDELETHFDKWLFVLKNLSMLERIPEKLQEKIFLKLFKQAEVAALTSKEQDEYEESLKVYRDLKNVIDTAKDEGFTEGKLEGEKLGIEKGRAEGKAEGENQAKIEIAKNLLKNGIDLEIIKITTGLTIDEIRKLSIVNCEE